MPSTKPERETATIELQMQIAGEEVRFQVTIPSGPATWEDLLPFMRSLVGVANQIAEERNAAMGRSVSCQAGCGVCCRQCVPIAEFEARHLLNVIDEMPEPRRSVIRSRFEDAAARLRAAGRFQDQESLGGMTPDQLIDYSREYFKLMIPCPFLEDESCSIHQERPLKCREHLVSSPAAYCADPENQPVTVIPLPMNVSRATLQLGYDSEDAGAQWLPLTSLLAWSETARPVTPNSSGPELLQMFMQTLANKPATGAGTPRGRA